MRSCGPWFSYDIDVAVDYSALLLIKLVMRQLV